MKATIETWEAVNNMVDKLGNCGWKRGKTILRIERFSKTLSDITNPFTTGKGKLLAQYVEHSPDGSLRITNDHPKFKEFDKEYREIADEEIDITLLCLIDNQDIEGCDSITLSMGEIKSLRSLGIIGETIEAGNAVIQETIEKQIKASSIEDKKSNTTKKK